MAAPDLPRNGTDAHATLVKAGNLLAEFGRIAHQKPVGWPDCRGGSNPAGGRAKASPDSQFGHRAPPLSGGETPNGAGAFVSGASGWGKHRQRPQRFGSYL